MTKKEIIELRMPEVQKQRDEKRKELLEGAQKHWEFLIAEGRKIFPDLEASDVRDPNGLVKIGGEQFRLTFRHSSEEDKHWLVLIPSGKYHPHNVDIRDMDELFKYWNA